MAWPPSTLATNRTNATPQTNTHPGDHNAVNAAMNDTVLRVLSIESGLVTPERANIALNVQSVDTPNGIQFHWDAPYLYYRIDGGEWFKITATPIGLSIEP